MITEDYVSFESAKLLKEKGFNKKCFTVYNNDGKFYDTRYGIAPSVEISAPTIQMAMKWLREAYRVVIEVSPLSFTLKGSKSLICDNWVFSLWINGNPIVSERYGNQTAYSTYEEACEAGIKYGLENFDLI